MKDQPDSDVFEAGYVQSVFDRMAASYTVVNLISSFGFSYLWRRRCVKQAGRIKGGSVVYDLMSGMGECTPIIDRQANGPVSLFSVDFSEAMTEKARARKNNKKFKNLKWSIFRSDVIHRALPEPDGADLIICCFGLKTLNDSDQESFAKIIYKNLKPGGRFSLIEISSAKGWILGPLYRFYLTKIIPIIGRLFLGDPDSYKMLGIYTEAFGNCERFADFLKDTGLSVTYKDHFFGCASSVSGFKLDLT